MNQIALMSFLLFSATGAFAQTASTVEERMSAAEFKAAGLNKLSADELKALNNWMNGQKMVVIERVVTVSVEKPAESTADIHSRLIGEFKGWRGNTVFTLENGQTWQQTDNTELFTKTLQSPKVVITHSSFSGWKIQVEGYNSLAKVKRIK